MPVNQFSTNNPQSDQMQIEAEQFDPDEFEGQPDDDHEEYQSEEDFRLEYENWLFESGESPIEEEMFLSSADDSEDVFEALDEYFKQHKVLRIKWLLYNYLGHSFIGVFFYFALPYPTNLKRHSRECGNLYR